MLLGHEMIFGGTAASPMMQLVMEFDRVDALIFLDRAERVAGRGWERALSPPPRKQSGKNGEKISNFFQAFFQ